MIKEYKQSKKPIESIVQHFILAIIIFCEVLLRFLNLILPSPKSIKSLQQKGGDLSKNKKELDLFKSNILSLDNNKLSKIVENVDLFSSLEKEQIISLIMGNKEAMKLLQSEFRRESLKQMTNQEIRSLLTRKEGISRLKKSELIEMVLFEENK